MCYILKAHSGSNKPTELEWTKGILHTHTFEKVSSLQFPMVISTLASMEK